jgi:acid phosphatase type 7
VKARVCILAVIAMLLGALTSQQSPAGAADPTIVAAGDIACAPGDIANPCQDEDTAALLPGNAAVLPLGDNQYRRGTLSEYKAVYAKSWGAFKPQSRPVPGNHEYKTTDAAGYYGYFGSRAGDPSKGYYSYNIGSWHLVALNSNCNNLVGRGVPGGCSGKSPMIRWLVQDLAADSHLCELVYFHHPRYSSSSPETRSMYPAWKKMVPAGVDVVLSGHQHNYERFATQDAEGQALADGIRQFVVGVGGDSFHSLDAGLLPNSEVSNDDTFGVLKMTLHSASYDWSFVQIAGSSFTDAGSARCHS